MSLVNLMSLFMNLESYTVIRINDTAIVSFVNNYVLRRKFVADLI